MKRIVTIQDISCFGKCSLTVALPIISALGVETAVIPTAVLSAHTQFENFTFHDLTEDIPAISNHWQQEQLIFDGIYTGYLGSSRQIDLVADFFDRFRKENTLVLVDPVMADNGQLYPGFSQDFPAQMAKLCAKADIIVPNITEACLMTGMPYKEEYDEGYIKTLLEKLGQIGAGVTVLTGVSFASDTTGIAGYERKTGEYFCYKHKKMDKSYPGTGDVFASTCVGAMMQGKSWQEAVQIAEDYTAHCIALTMQDPSAGSYSVNFEEGIAYLLKRVGLL